jgi:uncharacterized glyoxalase superfamily protein PhnB
VEQRAVPFLSYEDVGAAADWLTRVFGFEERADRYYDSEGRVTHAELELDGAIVMLGWPGPEYRSPKSHGADCEQARKWLEPPNVVDGVLVYVDDLDAHCERAHAAGATILREPAEEPYGKLYSAADIEGHRWMFMRASR